MRQAVSAGGFLVKKVSDEDHILLVKYSESGNLGLLKGHRKTGETLEETALREVREESGLKNISIIKKIGELTRESTEDGGEKALKTIHMFLMKTDDFNFKNAEEEVGWFEFDKATNNMKFKEEAEFLKTHKKEITR